jgi:beta-glucosidase
MTFQEKIGQMTLIEKGSINPADITDHFIGGLLSGGGGSPDNNTVEGWAEMAEPLGAARLQTTTGSIKA